jgi:hypothetical protein
MDSYQWRNRNAKAYWEEGGRQEGRIRRRRLSPAISSPEAQISEDTHQEKEGQQMTAIYKRIKAEHRVGQGSKGGTALPSKLASQGGPTVSKTTQQKQK